MKDIHRLTALLMMLVAATGCHGGRKARQSAPVEAATQTDTLQTDSVAKLPETDNSIYYWRTTFTLDDRERAFIDKHGIDKLYVRYFDVVVDYDDTDRPCIPSATLIFKDTIPSGMTVVPVVYITNAAADWMTTREAEYAAKIVKRVGKMCLRYGLELDEIQLDCDWTSRTAHTFHKLCEEVKALLDTSQTLSSTIRLHQLTQIPPPVDKGVLMVYNTGSLTLPSTSNSIFSKGDIIPYLIDNRLHDYPLPLDVAYPAYSWSVEFCDEYMTHVRRLMQRTDFKDFPQLKKTSGNTYEAKEGFDIPGVGWVSKGNAIRVERPSAKEILEIKQWIEKQLAGKPHHNVIYHLDGGQLSNYTDDEISGIYSRN